MPLLGIQSEMMFEGYFPVLGHYSNCIVNTSASVLPLNNGDNMFKYGNYYNGALLLPSADQHLVQNKEVMKQTMLRHEAMFKDQIHELHRVYWRQMVLMDELKKRELLNHHLQQGIEQSRTLSPHDLCDYAQKTSHVLSFPGGNPACNQYLVSAAEKDFSLSQFNDRKFALSVPDNAQNDFSSKGSEFQSSKKFGKKILDLELPPTEYMDSEDEESLQKVLDHPLNRISEAEHSSDWQPSHGSGGFNSVFEEDDLTPGSASFKKNLLADLHLPIKLEEKSGTTSIYMLDLDLNEPNKDEEEVVAPSKFLVDLNEPIELQEEEALSSDRSPLPGHVEFSIKDLSEKSNPGFHDCPTDLTHNNETGRDGQTCSNDLQLVKDDDEAGQSRTSLSSDLSGVSASLQNIDLKQAHEHETSHLINKRKRKSCSEDLESPGNDLSSNSNLLPVSTNILGTFQLISLTDEGNSKPSSVSSSKKHVCNIVQAPIIVQALPCRSSALRLKKGSKSSITGPVVSGKRSCHGKKLNFSRKFVKASFNQSSLCNGLSAESRALESGLPSIGSNGQDVSEEKDLAFKPHGLTKLEDSVRGLPWLETKLIRKSKRRKRSESSTQVETCWKPSKDDAIKNGANDRVININLDCYPVPESEEQVTSHNLIAGDGLDRKGSGFGASIVLDFCMEDDKSSPKPSLSTELGLQAPVSPENKESTPPRRDSDKNQVETPSELSGKEDGGVQEDLARNVVEAIASGEEDVDLQEELSRNAAMALVSISSSVVQTYPETTACESSKTSRSDELHWFAKVVSLVMDNPDSESQVVLTSKNNDDDDEEYMLFNGLDYFEAMTLNLIETKVEAADCFNNSGQKVQKEEESGLAYLPSQQSRGRMRRSRQQQKDFQSKILPSLASLSRCEVTEDIQTIEGMIQAANSQRGTVCTRSMSRNARAKGKKRSCISISSLTDTIICSPLRQHSCSGEERRLTSWGNITRRSRGPRSHATNPWLR